MNYFADRTITEPYTRRRVRTVPGEGCANLSSKGGQGGASLLYDSITLLEDFLNYVSFGSIYPIRNNYFGEPTDFTLYDKYLEKSSKLRECITKTLDFPALADIIADDFYTGGRTIPETVDKLGAFAGQSFLSWKNQAYGMFESMAEFGSGCEENEKYPQTEEEEE